MRVDINKIENEEKNSTTKNWFFHKVDTSLKGDQDINKQYEKQKYVHNY